LFYGIAPAALSFYMTGGGYYAKVALLAPIAVAGLFIGYQISLLDGQITGGRKVYVNSTVFHWAVWISFVLYAVVVFATASSIPFISALLGANTEQLSVQRGNFLKLRQGFQASFQYIDTIYIGFLLPYSLALMVLERRKGWPLAFVLFLLYSVSSLQKALFIRVLAPLGFLAGQQKVKRPLQFVSLIAIGAALILVLNVALERGLNSEPPPAAPTQEVPVAPTSSAAQQGTEQPDAASLGILINGYFDPLYIPSGVVDQIVWRTFAVPIFTAADAMVVFDDNFDGQLLWGATSTPIAALTGRNRINYDATVFAHQWGSSEIGRANSVFFTELFVNFGWVGVILGSIFIGLTFRWFSISSDFAFKSLITIYVIALFSAGVIGILFSNGFIFLFLVGLFGHISRSPRAAPKGAE
jgi:hypothetical protein